MAEEKDDDFVIYDADNVDGDLPAEEISTSEDNSDFITSDITDEIEDEISTEEMPAKTEIPEEETKSPTEELSEESAKDDDDKFLTPDEIEALAAKTATEASNPKNESEGDGEAKPGFFINKDKKQKTEKKKTNAEEIMRRNPDNITTARTVVIDFLEGTTKKSEATAYARGFIDNHFQSPQSCYLYVMPYEGSYAVEIHDGGNGRPYLPNIIKTLEEDPVACVCIQNRKRTLEIKRGDKGNFSSIMLPEGIDSTETNIVRVSPDTKVSMTPYTFSMLLFGVIGSAICLMGFLFLLLTSVVCLISYQRPVKILPTTKIRDLPILQWEDIMQKYNYDMYVEKVTYGNKRWKVAQRKAPVIESIAPEQYVEDITDAVKSKIKEDLRTGGFLSEEEKEEIAKHLQDTVVGAIDAGSVKASNVVETPNNTQMSTPTQNEPINSNEELTPVVNNKDEVASNQPAIVEPISQPKEVMPPMETIEISPVPEEEPTEVIELAPTPVERSSLNRTSSNRINRLNPELQGMEPMPEELMMPEGMDLNGYEDPMNMDPSQIDDPILREQMLRDRMMQMRGINNQSNRRIRGMFRDDSVPMMGDEGLIEYELPPEDYNYNPDPEGMMY